MIKSDIFSIQRASTTLILFSDHSVVDPPVPIPHTEVKHYSGDDSISENNTLLNNIVKKPATMDSVLLVFLCAQKYNSFQ